MANIEKNLNKLASSRTKCHLSLVEALPRSKFGTESETACLHRAFIRENNTQKNRMDESKTKESILVFCSHNITVV